jgi:MoCo/4Fe-4S cofactor protein with predicted Tat translocation signal
MNTDHTHLDWAAVRRRLADKTGPRWWRSLREIADGGPDAAADEFPPGASEWDSGVARRTFFQLMGASLGLAGMAGCESRPPEKIMPYVRAPQDITLGLSVAGTLAPAWAVWAGGEGRANRDAYVAAIEFADRMRPLMRNTSARFWYDRAEGCRDDEEPPGRVGSLFYSLHGLYMFTPGGRTLSRDFPECAGLWNRPPGAEVGEVWLLLLSSRKDAGVRPGDVLLRVNGRPIGGPTEFRRMVAEENRVHLEGLRPFTAAETE